MDAFKILSALLFLKLVYKEQHSMIQKNMILWWLFFPSFYGFSASSPFIYTS